MPDKLDNLEELLMNVQKVMRDNELFLKKLGDDTLEAGSDEEPPEGESDDGEGFEEL